MRLLASDDSDYVTGQTLFVDGGMTLYPGFATGGLAKGLDIHAALVQNRKMPSAFDSVVQEALVLPPDQRVALARQLLVSVEPEPQPDVEAAWDQEIRRRIARFDAGEASTVSADEVFARIRQIAPER